MDFGNGFYDDHHFHYGYHIYASAVLSKFDPAWGKQFYDRVMSLVRDVANPSSADPFFPTFRHKDWFLGSSWASGMGAANQNPNGRDQESTSEAINCYEAVALLGQVYAEIFSDNTEQDRARQEVAQAMQFTGRVMMTTEISSAQYYWHVRTPGPGIPQIYPTVYTQNVVGNVWDMLADFQTWFGAYPYYVYGIQLIPITNAAEARDNVPWVEEMVVPYNASCVTSPEMCLLDGWSIPVIAAQATLGDWQGAWQAAEAVPAEAFVSSGGDGHSLSNTLWWIATRKARN